MRKWKKVGYYQQGVVYALGSERKVVMPNCPVVHLKLDTKEVWWHQYTGTEKATGMNRDN